MHLPSPYPFFPSLRLLLQSIFRSNDSTIIRFDGTNWSYRCKYFSHLSFRTSRCGAFVPISYVITPVSSALCKADNSRDASLARIILKVVGLRALSSWEPLMLDSTKTSAVIWIVMDLDGSRTKGPHRRLCYSCLGHEKYNKMFASVRKIAGRIFGTMRKRISNFQGRMYVAI